MIGHQDKIKLFKKLIDNNKINHAYLFFGEPQVGKFLFAVSLVNYLEKKDFSAPENLGLLREIFIAAPDEKGTISIDKIRSLLYFLHQKPVFSGKRTVIVKDAENLTLDAQNAVLKIVEEPPLESLIIFISKNGDSLSAPLVSRLQKIYFPKVSDEVIEKFLVSIYGKKFSREKIKSAATESFGRPGRAIDLLENKELEEIKKAVKNFRGELPEEILDDSGKLDKFFEFLIADLIKDANKNLGALKETLKRLALMKMFNVNKKLQLRALSRAIK
ncbi:hypothetical protein HZB06_02150 [Candidatus Wolfebacteria bacterium]|nr:hypothetical protein [Candidatus Wolfebacteria bacterium]